MPTESFLTIAGNGSWSRDAKQQGNPGAAAAQASVCFRRAPRRRIAPQSGRALELLGHAIEYLADEYALSALQLGTLDSGDPRIEAVQVLMGLNRQIFYACPEVEPIWRRIVRGALSLMFAVPRRRP